MSSNKPRGYSLNDFLSWHENKVLILQPKFQRRQVWSLKAQSHLIDTILRDYPIPIIFIREQIDPSTKKTVREVVDGQQRLTSVLNFLNDEISVLKSQNSIYGGKTFSELPQDMQTNFLNYECPVMILQGATDMEVLKIFSRINSYSQKLTDQELLNAAFYGEFKETVYSLGIEHLEFWRENRILTDLNIMRMGEAELTSEIIVTMLTGVQRRRTKINESYKEYDDFFPLKKRIEKEFRKIIDDIANSFGDKLSKSIFRKRALFPSLFCAFYHLRYKIPNTRELKKPNKRLGTVKPSEYKAIQAGLDKLENKYNEFKRSGNPSSMEAFYNACQRSTSERDQRIVRIQTILGSIEQQMALFD